MFNKIESFIDNKEFKITLFKNMLNIINYEKIIKVEREYISLRTNKKIIRIKGEDMLLKKSLDNELLVTGQISKIEVIDE